MHTCLSCAVLGVYNFILITLWVGVLDCRPNILPIISNQYTLCFCSYANWIGMNINQPSIFLHGLILCFSARLFSTGDKSVLLSCMEEALDLITNM